MFKAYADPRRDRLLLELPDEDIKDSLFSSPGQRLRFALPMTGVATVVDLLPPVLMLVLFGPTALGLFSTCL